MGAGMTFSLVDDPDAALDGLHRWARENAASPSDGGG
jgi:hypothetical protein